MPKTRAEKLLGVPAINADCNFRIGTKFTETLAFKLAHTVWPISAKDGKRLKTKIGHWTRINKKPGSINIICMFLVRAFATISHSFPFVPPSPMLN